MATEFENFWNLYPRKVAKKDAERAWKRLNLDKRLAALEALPNHIARWDDKAWIPYPASWINGERWEDEIEDVKPEPKILGAWWSTHEGVEKRARELGLTAKTGEQWPQFKERVMSADKAGRLADADKIRNQTRVA